MQAPENLKSFQPFLKIAADHDQRDIIGKNLIILKVRKKKFMFTHVYNFNIFPVAYWARGRYFLIVRCNQ